MAFRFPSGTNTFIPSWEATHTLIAYTRDPKKFRLSKYVEYKKTTKRDAFYLKLDPDQPARIIDDSMFAWAPGADAPRGYNNIGNFQFTEFRCKKRAFPYSLPYEAVDQAEWGIQDQHAGLTLQQSMTLRTIRCATLLQTSSNWPSANAVDVNTLNGGRGKWNTASSDPASGQFCAIKETVLAALEVIKLYTNSVVSQEEMCLVVSPGCARRMAGTSEVHDYVKSPEGGAMLRGEEKVFGEWGLPNRLYNYPLIVEDAVKVTSNVNGTVVRGFCFNSANPVIVSKPGALAGQENGPSYSTVQIYFYREQEVQQKDDPDNERYQGRVVEDYSEQLAAGAAGMSMLNAL